MKFAPYNGANFIELLNPCYDYFVTAPTRDRILIVESDPLVADLISRQALQAAGFQTQVVNDASLAITRAAQANPDVLIVNLSLPGLSGKDLMVALTSQGLDIPVVVLAQKGHENELVQAFRLGAVDVMLWPLREPEVINVVERVLKRVRERKERDRLASQLQQTNQELSMRVRELTTIFAIGKAVTSITDHALLLERILEGGARVTQAEMGWFLMRSEDKQPFYLMAQRGLPPSVAELIQQPWEDGVFSLVALSGEALALHGDAVRRFKIAGLGQSVLIVPVKVQRVVIGLLVMMRKQAAPFSPSEQHLLEALADYSSISLSNARLFKTVEARARSQEMAATAAVMAERLDREILQNVKMELRGPLLAAQSAFDKLSKDPTARWTPEQRQAMAGLSDQIQVLNRIAEAIQPLAAEPSGPGGTTNLSQLLQGAASRCQPLARQLGVGVSSEVPPTPVFVQVSSQQVSQVLESLLSYALRTCPANGQVQASLTVGGGQAQILLNISGAGLTARQVASLFEPGEALPAGAAQRFGGLGVSLALAKEIVQLFNGKMWADSRPGAGIRLYCTFPIPA